MSFCPECLFEYPGNLMVCPDCCVGLVDAAIGGIGAASVPDDSWVMIGTVKNSSRTNVAKGSLDSSNIPSVIVDDTEGSLPVTGASLAGGRFPGHVIYVPREFREEAETILTAALGSDLVQPPAG